MKLKKIAYVVIIASLVLFRPDNQGEAHASGQPDPKVRTKPRPALPRYAQGEVLMKMDPSFKGYYKPSSLPEGAREMKKIDNFGLNRIMLKPGVSVEEAVESYKKLPGVAYAEPNYIYRSLAVTPSDTDFGIQWGLHNAGQVITQVYDPHTNTMIDGKGTADADIDATEAWDISTGSGEIIVAILDSGVSWNHPELIENIWQNPGETENGEDSDRNGYIDDVRGWDFIDTDNDPSDFNEHGTHIAGTLGATTNNGKGVAGVSWNVKIMPIRVLDTIGSGLTSSLVAAVNYAIDHGAKIINLSLGGPDMSQAFLDALERAQGAGILIVVACGNGDLDGIGDNNDIYPIYPASYDLDNIVSVAASDYNDNLTVFSNYGAKSVDIAAPGQYIYSTFPARKTVFADDFSTLADWTHGGVKDLWGLTSYLYYSPPSALTDSPNPEPYSEETGLYENSTDSWVRSKTFSLEGEIGCQLSYIFAGSLEPNKDFMQTEISSDGGLNWRPFTEAEGAGIFTGLMPEAVVMVHDLSAFENKPTIAIRFHLITDATGQDRGVLIDDVQVSCHSTTYAGDEYGFLEGTSMAAPFVSGVALLMMSNN
ncbi:MAG: S8 family serine peptidase, partial [Nitrospinota bacterium]|nr:S8 family serine peptidase [Nitrospinota bacterium]